jgi:hypothetical protein
MFDAVEFVVDRLTRRLAGVRGKGSGSDEGAGPLAFCVAAAAGRVLTKPNQSGGGGNGGTGIVQCVPGPRHGQEDRVGQGASVGARCRCGSE